MAGLQPDALPPVGGQTLPLEKDVSIANTPEAIELDNHKPEDGLQRGNTNQSIPLNSKARTIALVVTLTGAAFLNTLCVQAAVIILPTIGDELSIPPSRQQWIISSYSLTFGCFLLLWGRLADVYGKRLIFIYGSIWITLINIVLPFCPNEISFDVLRGLQGLGAAANVPTAIGIIGVTFPPGKAKNYAFSFYGCGAPLGSVFGNLLGGVVAQYASWKWVFWVLAVIAAVVSTAGILIIPRPPVQETSKDLKAAVDWIGGTLITVSLLALLFALTEGNVVGWSTPWIPAVIVVSIFLVGIFVLWQLYLEKKTTRAPLMKVTIFKNSKVSAAMVTMAVFNSSFNNFLIFATYYYQDYQGYDPIQTTLRFIPTGVFGVATIFVTSQLLARVAVNYIMIWGLCCITIASLLFAVPISPDETWWAYGFPAMCLSVCGADTLFPSLILFTASSLPRENQALGGALINAVGQVGRAIGLAIATAIQVAVQAKREGTTVTNIGKGGDSLHNQAYLQSLRAANWFDFALAVVGVFIVAFALRGAGTMGAVKK